MGHLKHGIKKMVLSMIHYLLRVCVGVQVLLPLRPQWQ